MQRIRYFMATAAVFAPLALTACGDGWVVQPYKGIPYDGRGIDDDEHTAGYGVEYVRANMLPAKEMNTQPVAPAAPQEPIKDAAPLYEKIQKK